MADFFSTPIIAIEHNTEDCAILTFEVPANKSEAFYYNAGQYIVVKVIIDGKEVRRSYSLCNTPSENKLSIAIKAIPKGVFSNYANKELKVGDVLEISEPQGNFVINDDDFHNKKYVAFAVGSGITPIISQIKDILSSSESSQVILFYGNKNSNTIIFKAEIEALKNIYLNRLSVHHVLSKERLASDLFYGRIDKEKCKVYGSIFFEPQTIANYMLCGPFDMTNGIKEYLLEQAVEEEKILMELFVSPDQIIKKDIDILSKEDAALESNVAVKIDGDNFDFPLSFGGENILDAAISKGADLPYACKGGVCGTCKAKVVKGTVSMDINYALEEDELQKGYVLTCQAHPRSNYIEIDFDQKS